jgi:hypothetical protein
MRAKYVGPAGGKEGTALLAFVAADAERRDVRLELGD